MIAPDGAEDYTVAVSITAIVENNSVKLPEGVHIPDGTLVRLEIAATGASKWPEGYFERTAGALAGEQFERPPQGESQERDDW